MSVMKAVTSRGSGYAKLDHFQDEVVASVHLEDPSARSAQPRLSTVLGEPKMNNKITKRITLTLAVIAVAAAASACDFRNPDGGQQVHGPAVFPTPAVLTSTF
jgi:hypothetical protein